MKPSSTSAFVNQMVVSTLVMICFGGSIGLSTVWLRHQISLTANSTRVIEQRITELERRIADTRAAIACEEDPASLLRRNAEWHLGLVSPTPNQVMHMDGDPIRRLAAKRNRGLFGDTAIAVTFPYTASTARH